MKPLYSGWCGKSGHLIKFISFSFASKITWHVLLYDSHLSTSTTKVSLRGGFLTQVSLKWRNKTFMWIPLLFGATCMHGWASVHTMHDMIWSKTDKNRIKMDMWWKFMTSFDYFGYHKHEYNWLQISAWIKWKMKNIMVMCWTCLKQLFLLKNYFFSDYCYTEYTVKKAIATRQCNSICYFFIGDNRVVLCLGHNSR